MTCEEKKMKRAYCKYDISVKEFKPVLAIFIVYGDVVVFLFRLKLLFISQTDILMHKANLILKHFILYPSKSVDYIII